MPALSSPARSRGVTLLETLIALVLSLVIISALVTLFIQHRASHRQNEAIAGLQDSARFALHVLSRDLLMAGHWGGPPDAAYINVDSATTALPAGADCGATTTEVYALNIARKIEFFNNIVPEIFAAQHLCFDAAELVPGSDLLVVRYARGLSAASLTGSQTQASLAPHTLYVQANHSRGTLFRSGSSSTFNLNPAYVPQGAPLAFREYVFNIYFLRPYAETPDDEIPSLCRRELRSGATLALNTECLAEGMQDLQLSFGIDEDEDSLPERYVSNPDDAQLADARSVEIEVLARSRGSVPGYRDRKSFEIGDKTGEAAIGSANDDYFRRLYSTTVALRNTPFSP
jgi:type IV pilus assembly protein PilW